MTSLKFTAVLMALLGSMAFGSWIETRAVETETEVFIALPEIEVGRDELRVPANKPSLLQRSEPVGITSPYEDPMPLESLNRADVGGGMTAPFLKRSAWIGGLLICLLILTIVNLGSRHPRREE